MEWTMNEYYIILGLLAVTVILNLTVIHGFGKLIMHMNARFNEMFLLVAGMKTLDDLIEGFRSESEPPSPVLFEDMGSE